MCQIPFFLIILIIQITVRFRKLTVRDNLRFAEFAEERFQKAQKHEAVAVAALEFDQKQRRKGGVRGRGAEQLQLELAERVGNEAAAADLVAAPVDVHVQIGLRFQRQNQFVEQL